MSVLDYVMGQRSVDTSGGGTGGGGIFVFSMVQGEYGRESDKTASEIYDAVKAGKLVYRYEDVGGDESYQMLTSIYRTSSGDYSAYLEANNMLAATGDDGHFYYPD